MKKYFAKILLLLFVVITICSLSSCDKDDNHVYIPNNSNYLIGEWDLRNIQIKIDAYPLETYLFRSYPNIHKDSIIKIIKTIKKDMFPTTLSFTKDLAITTVNMDPINNHWQYEPKMGKLTLMPLDDNGDVIKDGSYESFIRDSNNTHFYLSLKHKISIEQEFPILAPKKNDMQDMSILILYRRN